MQPGSTTATDAELLDRSRRGEPSAFGEIYDRYFAAFENRLALEYETDRVRDPIGATTGVVPLASFSERLRRC